MRLAYRINRGENMEEKNIMTICGEHGPMSVDMNKMLAIA